MSGCWTIIINETKYCFHPGIYIPLLRTCPRKSRNTVFEDMCMLKDCHHCEPASGKFLMMSTNYLWYIAYRILKLQQKMSPYNNEHPECNGRIHLPDVGGFFAHSGRPAHRRIYRITLQVTLRNSQLHLSGENGKPATPKQYFQSFQGIYR